MFHVITTYFYVFEEIFKLQVKVVSYHINTWNVLCYNKTNSIFLQQEKILVIVWRPCVVITWKTL